MSRLAPGTRIGVYEITGPLGSGGMGEVYRARDTRLGRDVAVKVLPDAFAFDADRVARFEREAKVLASLNHPHIAQVFGLEHTALVMELVEGDDLSDRIGRGLPPAQVTSIARQLSEALAAAHDRGIIHRDLKPANIKLRPDGTIKILDFGLAKAAAADTEATITHAGLTEAGMVMGTAGYMSPEQAAGREVDARTDIWAFGCVLFEMCAGQRPFTGQSSVELIASVIKDEPAWEKLEGTPAALRSLIKRCLQKDVSNRLRHIADARAWMDDTPTAGPQEVAGRSVLERSMTLVGVIAAVALAAGVPTWMLLTREAAPPPPTVRFQIPISDTERFIVTPAGNTLAISRDGKTVIYPAIVGDSFQWFRRPLDAAAATPIAGTERAQNVTFSPDGTEIAFYSRGAIRTVPVGGGSPATVCVVEGASPFITWSDTGYIFFLTDTELKRVVATGGTPETVVKPDPSLGEGVFFALGSLPGGGVITQILPVPGGNRRARIGVLPPGGTAFKTLLEDASVGQYAAGYFWYNQAKELHKAPLDLARLEITGEANVVGPAAPLGVMAPNGNRASAGGEAGHQPMMRLVWLTPSGQLAGVVADNLLLARHPRVSPDGSHLSVVVGPGNSGSAWRYSIRSGAQPVRLTFQSSGGVHYPIWRPAGDALTYLEGGQRFGLFTSVADGAANAPSSIVPRYDALPEDWTPDGTTLIYQAVAAMTGVDLLLHDQRTGEDRPWLQTPFDEAEARISPDGRWVAYVSNPTGRNEVWIKSFAGTGPPLRVSADGGHEPRWSKDGKVIYFHTGPRMMASDVTLTPEPRASTPRVLFEGGFIPYNTSFRRTYDVAPDGRFLVVQRTSEPGELWLNVVVNALPDAR